MASNFADKMQRMIQPEALKKNDFSAAALGDFQKRVESSWIKDELWKVRNFHQGFEQGFFAGMLHIALSRSNSFHSACLNSPGRTKTYAARRSAARVVGCPSKPSMVAVFTKRAP